jgi:putative transposase
MNNNPIIHHRHSIRLKGYDYSQNGAYFVTLVSYGRESLFGEIVKESMEVNSLGQIVLDVWDHLPEHYAYVHLDEFCIMPNHIHGIILLSDEDIAGEKHYPLPEIVRAFKTFSARSINSLRATSGQPIWQRNYYEHIIRDENELNRARAYIDANPLRWSQDEDNPARDPSGRGGFQTRPGR